LAAACVALAVVLVAAFVAFVVVALAAVEAFAVEVRVVLEAFLVVVVAFLAAVVFFAVFSTMVVDPSYVSIPEDAPRFEYKCIGSVKHLQAPPEEVVRRVASCP